MMKWSDIKAMVPSPGAQPNYSGWLYAFPALEFAKTTPQSKIWHAEGDVWTHTKMVCDELVTHPEYAALTLVERETVFTAAMLHDIAKYSTTVVDEAGVIRQPGHSGKGAVDARIALWDAGTPFSQREEICRMISVHQLPFHVLGISRRGKTPEFLVRELSWTCNTRLLALLAEVDMRGRICADQSKLLDDIQRFREFCERDGCYGQPRQFADDHTRLSYFRGANVHPDYSLYQVPGSKVTVMCGLPASGKNWWAAENRKGQPVVSFDDARSKLGLRHGKNEGLVGHTVTAEAQKLLRLKEPFVWNATHLGEMAREKTLSLLFQYGAEVELIYLEQPRAELLRRNSRRDTSLSNKALLAMLYKWDLPLPFEAHRVRYDVA